MLARSILGRYRTMTVVAFTLFFGALGVVPIGVSAFLHAAHAFSPRTVFALGYIVVFPTVATYFLNADALRRVPSSLVAIYVYLQAVAGILLAAAILGERPGRLTLLGGAAIFAGSALAVLDRRLGAPSPSP